MGLPEITSQSRCERERNYNRGCATVAAHHDLIDDYGLVLQLGTAGLSGCPPSGKEAALTRIE